MRLNCCCPSPHGGVVGGKDSRRGGNVTPSRAWAKWFRGGTLQSSSLEYAEIIAYFAPTTVLRLRLKHNAFIARPLKLVGGAARPWRRASPCARPVRDTRVQ